MAREKTQSHESFSSHKQGMHFSYGRDITMSNRKRGHEKKVRLNQKSEWNMNDPDIPVDVTKIVFKLIKLIVNQNLQLFRNLVKWNSIIST